MVLVEVENISGWSESDLVLWLDHVEDCFRKKGTPRQYFEDHLFGDPFRNKGAIFASVVYDDNNKLNKKVVSTVRIFNRQVYIKGEMVDVAGIGEVSTREEYRKHGLATKLLKAAINHALDQGMVPLLHAGVGYQNFYRDLGFVPIPINIGIFEFCDQVLSLSERGSSSQVRTLNLLNAVDRQMCQRIYSEMSYTIDGAVVRDSVDYWDVWVSKGCARLGFEVFWWEPSASEFSLQESSSPLVGAYMIVQFDLKSDSNRLVVHELFCNVRENTTIALRDMLVFACKREGAEEGRGCQVEMWGELAKDVDVDAVPFVLNDIRVEHGWMAYQQVAQGFSLHAFFKLDSF